MPRTSIDLDDEACRLVMRRYGLSTRQEAVNFALRELAAVFTVERARQLKGSGWVGDLDQMRGSRGLDT